MEEGSPNLPGPVRETNDQFCLQFLSLGSLLLPQNKKKAEVGDDLDLMSDMEIKTSDSTILQFTEKW